MTDRTTLLLLKEFAYNNMEVLKTVIIILLFFFLDNKYETFWLLNNIIFVFELFTKILLIFKIFFCDKADACKWCIAVLVHLALC